MLAAIATGVLVRRHAGASLPIPRWQSALLGISAFIGGALFAKLPYALGDWEGLRSGTAWVADGRTLTWGFVGGYLGVEVAKWALSVRVKTGDSFAVPVAASIAMGRLGCFVGGCCFGRETSLPWSVDFGDGVHRHPTQLYESAFHAIAAVVLHRMGARGAFPGQRIKLYVMAYMIYRFFTEWLRPEPIVGMGLTFYQWSALAFFACFAALFMADARVHARPVTS
jgi:phosphatidylglycerol:prolipoprotein diacylglycerol transferase